MESNVIGPRVPDDMRMPSDAVTGDVLDRIARCATTLVGARVACVWLADARERVLRLHAHAAADPELEGLARRLTPVPRGTGVVGRIFESRKLSDLADVEDDVGWRGEPRLQSLGLRAHAGVPIVAGQHALGVLSVFCAECRALSDAEKDLLELLAEHAALAIEHHRVVAESERRERAAESLERVGRLMLQSLDPHDVGQRIVDSVRVLVGAQRATLVQKDPHTDALSVLAISGEEAFPLGTGVAGFAVRERRPLITRDLLADPRIALTHEVRAHLERVSVRAVLSVPLLVGDAVIGALSVGDRSGRVFEQDEIQLLQMFADQAAIAIHNAGLYDETRRQEQEAVALEEVAREITSSLDQDEIFQRIVGRARDLTGSDLSFLAPYDQRAGIATIVAASGVGTESLTAVAVRPGQGAGGQVLESAKPFVTDDYPGDPRLARMESEFPLGSAVVAVAVVPLVFRGRITGLLWVANGTPRGFTTRDVRVLLKLADQGAIALENSRLYAEAQELAVSRERVRVATELHDTLSQMLFSVALGLDWCLHRLAGASELRTRIQEIKRETGVVMKQLRALIGHLAPDHDPTESKPGQLQRLVREFRELTGIPAELVEQGDVHRLGPRQQEILYKTFQEGLANVAKHARATRATVRIEVGQDEVAFEVADDGVGLPADVDTARLARVPGHFGLRQMLERIEGEGGAVSFGLARPTGFRLRGRLPIR